MEKLKHFLKQPFWQVLIALFVLEAVFTPEASHSSDKKSFVAWLTYINAHGISQAYHFRDFNYPPLITYPLWLFAKLIGAPEYFETYFHFFKLLALTFDFAAIALLIKRFGNKENELVCLLLFLANPLFIYNSYCWGQVDGVLAALVFFSFCAAISDKPIAALILIVIALNFKVQAVIFLPLLGLYMLWKLSTTWKFKQIVLGLFAAIVVQLLILLPFIIAGETGRVIDTIFKSVDFYPVISMSAYNFWHLIYSGDLSYFPDNRVLFNGITVKQAGLLMFFTASLLLLAPPFILIVYSWIKKKRFNLNNEILFLMCAIIPLFFFYFNSQMHERYSHPAIIFTTAYSVAIRKPYLAMLVLLPYGLNMESQLKFFNLPNYGILLLNRAFVAALYGVSIITLLFLYYKTLYKAYPNYERPTT